MTDQSKSDTPSPWPASVLKICAACHQFACTAPVRRDRITLQSTAGDRQRFAKCQHSRFVSDFNSASSAFKIVRLGFTRLTKDLASSTPEALVSQTQLSFVSARTSMYLTSTNNEEKDASPRNQPVVNEFCFIEKMSINPKWMVSFRFHVWLDKPHFIFTPNPNTTYLFRIWPFHDPVFIG